MPDSEAHAEPQLNATPLIDVLLVLLVMLIFTLPVMSHATKLSLPQAGPSPTHIVAEKIFVGIDFDAVLTWNNETLESFAALEEKLARAHSMVPQPIIAIHPDARSCYEPVAQVLAAAQRARIDNVQIVDSVSRRGF